jgi:hypothetical protein
LDFSKKGGFIEKRTIKDGIGEAELAEEPEEVRGTRDVEE